MEYKSRFYTLRKFECQATSSSLQASQDSGAWNSQRALASRGTVHCVGNYVKPSKFAFLEITNLRDLKRYETEFMKSSEIMGNNNQENSAAIIERGYLSVADVVETDAGRNDRIHELSW